MEKQEKKLVVEVEGIKYPAHSSLGAILLFKKETGKEVNEINCLTDSIIWLWCCVKSASAKTDNPLKMNCQEFADSCDMETLNLWTESQQSENVSKKK